MLTLLSSFPRTIYRFYFALDSLSCHHHVPITCTIPLSITLFFLPQIFFSSSPIPRIPRTPLIPLTPRTSLIALIPLLFPLSLGAFATFNSPVRNLNTLVTKVAAYTIMGESRVCTGRALALVAAVVFSTISVIVVVTLFLIIVMLLLMLLLLLLLLLLWLFLFCFSCHYCRCGI